jgi:adenylate cyclase
MRGGSSGSSPGKNHEMKNLSRIITFYAGVVTAIVMALYYYQPVLLERFEEKTYDYRFRFVRGSLEPLGLVAIIAIDDASIEELGRWPWSRAEHVRLLKRLHGAGARAVLFDVMFPEPESPDADKAFAKAIKEAGMVTLATAFVFSPDGEATSRFVTLPALTAELHREAHINVSPDDDGVLRFTRLLVRHGDRLYPSLGLAGAMDRLGAAQFKAGEYSVSIGDRTIPTDPDFRYLINYAGPHGTFKRISYADVVRGRVSDAELRDKVLLVGPTALGISDMRITPYSNNTPGVEVNANVIESIVRGDFMHRGGVEALIDLIGIVMIGAAVAFIAGRFRVQVSLFFVILAHCAYVAFVSLMFVWGRWLSFVYPMLSGALCYAGASYFRFVIMDKRAKEIRQMFSCYVSPKLVEQLVCNPELAHVGGESKVITIMFADVRNYTGYSENRTPREVVNILNEYLAAMTEVIMAHDGTIDKFLGDGIMAYWGAPVPEPNHAELAVRCAVKMVERLEVLQKKWAAEGLEPLLNGIGINTGEVIVGNLGVEGKKMEYTIIGDNVNLTSRIQNESREHNCPIITQAVYERVRDMAVADYIGPVMVKGKEKSIDIYALRGIKSS